MTEAGQEDRQRRRSEERKLSRDSVQKRPRRGRGGQLHKKGGKQGGLYNRCTQGGIVPTTRRSSPPAADEEDNFIKREASKADCTIDARKGG